MGTRRIAGVALGFLVTIVGCGGDSGNGPSQSQLVGTWSVTKCEYVSTTGLGSVDLIAGGGTGTLVLGADKSLQLDVTPISGPPVTLTATYEISGIDLMKVTPAGVSWYWAWDMSLSGNTLSLTGADAQYDFNQDQTLDPAKWNLEMTK